VFLMAMFHLLWKKRSCQKNFNQMNPINIIEEFYAPKSLAFDLLIMHSSRVAEKAGSIALNVPHLNPDLKFIYEASMLHDIGIFLTDAPDLGCHGKYPYICHGWLGRSILEKKGFIKHALVCERHVGTGISVQEIKNNNLPLPERDMLPVSIEEQIICFADKFFSKGSHPPDQEISVEKIIAGLEKYGHDKVLKFKLWMDMFSCG